jgi:hypothetical protein
MSSDILTGRQIRSRTNIWKSQSPDLWTVLKSHGLGIEYLKFAGELSVPAGRGGRSAHPECESYLSCGYCVVLKRVEAFHVSGNARPAAEYPLIHLKH